MVSHIQLVLKPHVTDVTGRAVEESARRFLGIDTGTVRTAKLFTILGDLTAEQLRLFATEAVCDGIVQDVLVDRLHQDPASRSYLIVSRRPGVTDDEGASAQRALADLLGRPELAWSGQCVFSREAYFFEHALERAQLERVGTELVGNPLVHRFQCGATFDHLEESVAVEAEVDPSQAAIDLDLPDDRLAAISRERMLALDLVEMRAIRDHFASDAVASARREQGLPAGATEAEIEILAQTWSEHCKHKEFNAIIRYRDLATGRELTIDSLFDTYIRKATRTVKARLARHGNDWLVGVFADNAGIVQIDDSRLFVFKVETHNSPSALDPYGGALTGIVGVNRDPMGTGRGGARLLFNTNVLCFGRPDHAGPLLPGQMHPRRILDGVRRGIEDGGNKSGVPTVAGAVVFDDRYAGKPLVFCGTGAIMPCEYAGKPSWTKEVSAGDVIVTAGGRVGKDGIHGATFSSVEIDEASPRSAVQIGSPITQKMLSDFLELACRQGLVKCCTDNGAGGLSSSVGELARFPGGARVDLEKVPLKYPGLKPWEIFVSESQERMTLVVEPDRVEELLSLARGLDVEIAPIGRFTSDGVLDVRYDGKPVARLDMEFLHEGVPRKTLEAEWAPPSPVAPVVPRAIDHGETLLSLLSSLDICSRERIVRQYDHEVKGLSVIKPLMGPLALAPQDAAVMRLDHDSYVGVAVSHGIAPRYGDLDPYEMSRGAFDEAVRQIVGTGGRLPVPDDPRGPVWSVNDNFCVPDSVFEPRTNPDGKRKLGALVRMCQGLRDMATFFGIPLTSGKDSMKNDLRVGDVKISVPPTVLYSMVARVDDVRRTVTTDFKAGGDRIYLVGKTFDELGGSQFLRLSGQLGSSVPRVRPRHALRIYRKLQSAIAAGLLESCHDLSDGGLAVALAEASFGGVGFDVTLPRGGLPAVKRLYSESHSRFVVSVRPGNRQLFESTLGADATFLGTTGTDRAVVRSGRRAIVDLPVSSLLARWRGGLEAWT